MKRIVEISEGKKKFSDMTDDEKVNEIKKVNSKY
jgi:hypothetical protein